MSSAPHERRRHILDEIDFLIEESRGLTKAEFIQDRLRQRAFVRSLEINGEAVKKLSPDLRGRYPQVQWALIAGMRDHLIHGYFSVDYDIVWDAVTAKVLELQDQIREVLETEDA